MIWSNTNKSIHTLSAVFGRLSLSVANLEDSKWWEKSYETVGFSVNHFIVGECEPHKEAIFVLHPSFGTFLGFFPVSSGKFSMFAPNFCGGEFLQFQFSNVIIALKCWEIDLVGLRKAENIFPELRLAWSFTHKFFYFYIMIWPLNFDKLLDFGSTKNIYKFHQSLRLNKGGSEGPECILNRQNSYIILRGQLRASTWIKS